nr:hypothetical protein [Microbacterium bovistercoris]
MATATGRTADEVQAALAEVPDTEYDDKFTILESE